MDINDLQINNETLEKLNYLYMKSKTMEGLTDEELEEQGSLRELYLNYFKEKININN